MTTKNLVIFLVIILVVALGAGAYYFYFSDNIVSPISQTSKIPEITPLPATGNIDGAIDSILLETAAEESLDAEVEDDASLVDDDSQAIDDFGQSVNENEF